MWQRGEGPDTDATSGNERWALKMWAVTDKAKSPIWQKKNKKKTHEAGRDKL